MVSEARAAPLRVAVAAVHEKITMFVICVVLSSASHGNVALVGYT